LSAVVGILVILCFAGYFWAVHQFNESFFKISKADIAPFETLIKSAVTTVVVVKQPAEQRTPPSGGYLKAYETDPSRFQADAKLFDAWTSELEIGEKTLESTPSGAWIRSSGAASSLPANGRADPWNHYVCLLRRVDTLAIVSAGPKATDSPICRNIQIGEKELDQLPKRKLLQSP
jgi:hypothetical protein